MRMRGLPPPIGQVRQVLYNVHAVLSAIVDILHTITASKYLTDHCEKIMQLPMDTGRSNNKNAHMGRPSTK